MGVDPTSAAEHDTEHDAGFDAVYADILRGFPELVTELGGDPAALLREAGIDPSCLSKGTLRVGYRLTIALLEQAAAALHRPDFGLRLAALQGGVRVFGPIGGVMKNSRTLGEALDYVETHAHAHSLAARIRHERDPATGAVFCGHEILLEGLPNKTQAIEQLLLLGHLTAVEITGGQARVRKVLFRHQPLSPLSTYRRYFGCDVRFDQQEDGVVFSERDLLCPIMAPDAQAYASATSFIDTEFPRVSPPMHAQVRGLIRQFVGTEDCSNERVAAELGLHPRTLHRRLRAEAKTFQEIKDEVRRDAALYYLQQTDLDLTHIAEKLGYAEHSVLTRSCIRWFSASPSQLRAQADRQR
jgi:AraC-like DNA-binding protein